MEDPQNLNGIDLDPVGNDVRVANDHPFACTRDPTRAPQVRVLFQLIHAREMWMKNALYDRLETKKPQHEC